MVAFHGVTSYRIAGILPAVFILSSCCTSPDATKMVAFHGVTSYRIAGILPALKSHQDGGVP
jgi:hypothetical protein